MLLRYALLASLALEPRSGYDLMQWFATVTSHFWMVGHSSIYPALAQLEREGLVTHESQPSEQGPARKVYSLTPAGREHLMDWAEQPAGEADVRDEQVLKALCYGLLPLDTARALLGQARARYEQRLAYYEQIAEKVQAEQPGTEHEYSRLGRLITVRCGILGQQSKIAWCDEALRLLEAAHTDAGEHTTVEA